MKVAYIFTTTTSQKILSTMIIPQLETGRHGVDVGGMFFFMDNAFMLVEGIEVADRLQKLAEKNGMMLMGCDQCCYERNIQNRLIRCASIGCFPGLYKALAAAGGVDQVITL